MMNKDPLLKPLVSLQVFSLLYPLKNRYQLYLIRVYYAPYHRLYLRHIIITNYSIHRSSDIALCPVLSLYRRSFLRCLLATILATFLATRPVLTNVSSRENYQVIHY